MSRRIGILGGTFDPIHNGHTDLGAAAKTALNLSRVFVIPASIPPHRQQPSASSFHRFAMTAMAVAGLDGWRASDLELRVGAAPSYTTATLQRFHERGFAPSELFFIIGADAFAEIGTWKDYPRILDRAHFAVVSRPGCPVAELPGRLPVLKPRMMRPPLDDIGQIEPVILLIDEPTADVSSTAIRDRRSAGHPITGLVHRAVEQHIEQHGLYTSPIPGRRAIDQVNTSAAGRLHGQS